MSEPNPYEPPREPEPLTTEKVVKRGIGVVAIVLLTPVAAFATFFVSCLVAISTTTSPIQIEPPPDAPRSSEAVFWALTLIPTSVVTAAMLFWAARRGVKR
jgi:hypothetical protein